MTFPGLPWPAFAEAVEDDVLTPAAFRVYLRLVRDPRVFTEARPFKVGNLARDMGVSYPTALYATRMLIDRGYVVEHSRGANGVMRLQVPTFRQPCNENLTPPAAA